MNEQSATDTYWRYDAGLWYLMSPDIQRPLGCMSARTGGVWGDRIEPITKLSNDLTFDEAMAVAKLLILANRRDT